MNQLNGDKTSSRRSREQLRGLLTEFEKQPGMTVKAFCRLHQITEGSFYTARKRYRSSELLKQPSSPGFIAMGAPAFNQTGANLFAEVNGIRLFQAVSADYLKSLIG
jgi:transposase-like protein